MNRFHQILSGLGFVWSVLARRARGELALSGLLMAGAAWLNARIPVVLGDLASQMQSAVAGGRNWGLDDARAGLLILAGCFLLRELANVWRKFVVHKVATKAERDIAVSLMGHLLRLDLSEFSTSRDGSLHGRVKRCVEGLVKLLKLGFLDFFPALLTAGFAVGVASHRNPLLGLVIVSSLPLLLGVVFWQAWSQQGIRVLLLRSKEQMDGTFVEQLAGLEYIRSADTHDAEEARIARDADALRIQEMRHHAAMGGFDFLKTMIESVFFVLVAGLSIWLASRRVIAVGEIITSTMLFASVLAPVREIHRIIDEASESSISVADLREMLAKPLDKSFSPRSPTSSTSETPSLVIEAKGLKVEYLTDSAVRKTVLAGFDISIPPGQFVGIVGLTGCGKSTFLKSLLRLVHPSEGSLKLQGRPIDSFSRYELRKNFGVVGQKPFLFCGTLRENLCYGVGAFDDWELDRAVKAAALDRDIAAMPGRYLAPVCERGKNLSVGQCQRVALARILLKPRPIIVLDEATSALDNSSEAAVLNSILALKGHSTILMIAHRLSTLRDADRILVFEGGKIVEDGSYAELLANNGRFAALVRDGTNTAR
jgi:ATP-binding cassette subfamily B protein